MRIEACLLFLFPSLVPSLRRGPHHPHGQSRLKHEHHHHKPQGDLLTGDSQLLHDTKHIEEDNKELTPEDLAKMTPEELEFHYFSAHDFDSNSKLDGSELLKAIYHTMEYEEDAAPESPVVDPQVMDLDDYIALVDRTLASDDTDGDGYVSYAEYRVARARHATETPRVVAAQSVP